MKKIFVFLWVILVTCSQAFDVAPPPNGVSSPPDGRAPPPDGRAPPQESQEACVNKPIGDTCSFIGSRNDEEVGVCEYTPDNKYYACKPNRNNQQNERPENRGGKNKSTPKYSIEQATSDNAQLNTISFAAMSFMSSGLCEMSFLPPGKHASYFGFQYLRDVVGKEAGHGQNFVPSVANNLLYILSSEQKSILINLAKKQQEKIEKFALMRFPLLISFEKFAKNQFPNNTSELNKEQIIQQSGELYALDGELSFGRAIGFASVINSLTQEQNDYLNEFKDIPYDSWPNRDSQINKREFDHEVHVAIMTYASELFSWYLGDVKKDTYFTPERTASYFGSYWTKAAPMKAVKRDNYRISTALTSDSGKEFLQSLDNNHKTKITSLVQQQKPFLKQQVDIREAISKETRKIYNGEKNNLDKIVKLSKKFGELDGEIAYLYVNAFSNIKNNLSSSQLEKAIVLRNISQYECNGAFIYAEPSSVPEIDNINSFFK